MTAIWIIIFVMSMLAILHSYVLYPALLMWLERVMPPDETAPTGIGEPRVSIIIAAHNEVEVIGARATNLLALDYPNAKLESVIISDGSTDGTDEVVQQYPEIRLLRQEPRRGKVSALNMAVAQTTGKILVFSDANTMFDRDAIRELLLPFADSRVGCVVGRLIFEQADSRGVQKAEGLYWRIETMIKRCEGRRGSLLGANGAIYALRRDCWEPAPEGTLVDDFVIAMRVLLNGRRVVYAPQAVAREDSPPQLRDEFKRRIRIGAGDFQALSWFWPLLNPAHGFSAFAFFSHKVLRWLTPFFMVAMMASGMVLGLIHGGVWWLPVWVQLAGYGFAMLGLFSAIRERVKLAATAAHFVSMNAALLLGFFRWLRRSQQVTWHRTSRAASAS
jgi:cellulose synthase/poly-beta-1,6-N-acetylglucosamine synthase-like glycosyltransferase